MRRPGIQFFLLAAAIVAFFISCTIKDPVGNRLSIPSLSNLAAPESVFLRTEAEFSVSVQVTDPQGWQDISLVSVLIFSQHSNDPIARDTLQDDGLLGDIVPRDGVFFGLIPIDIFNNTEGSFTVSAFAKDSDMNISDTIHATITVYDAEKNQPPVLSQPVVPDTMNNPFLLNAFLSVRAADPQGLDDIDTVGFSIYLPYGVAPYFEDILSDDGQDGDAAPRDGIYSYNKNLSDTLRIGGPHSIRFWAFDQGGLLSNAVVCNFIVNRVNDPPVIVQVTAPDTVDRNPAKTFPIYTEVMDPQSLDDIQMVYFMVTKPDGSSNGIPLEMFDDGETEGDAFQSDGIYTLTVIIEPHNDLGTYRFDFTARDLSGALSETVSHFITVVDEPE